MASKRLTDRLSTGKAGFGSWIAFTDLYSVEVMSRAGFDWLLVDLEHCPIGLNDIRAMLPIAELNGTSMIFRVPDHSDYWIKQVLDLGADGVMVPRVDSAEIARRAVSLSKYYPLGERGFGPVRASRYGDDPVYVRSANEGVLLFAQLEHRLAWDNLDQILEVEGIDGYFIGAGDLSQSLGLLGELRAREVNKVVRKIIEKLNRKGKVWGAITTDKKMFRQYLRLGGRILTLGGDLNFLKETAERSVEQMRSVAEELEAI